MYGRSLPTLALFFVALSSGYVQGKDSPLERILLTHPAFKDAPMPALFETCEVQGHTADGHDRTIYYKVVERTRRKRAVEGLAFDETVSGDGVKKWNRGYEGFVVGGMVSPLRIWNDQPGDNKKSSPPGNFEKGWYNHPRFEDEPESIHDISGVLFPLGIGNRLSMRIDIQHRYKKDNQWQKPKAMQHHLQLTVVGCADERGRMLRGRVGSLTNEEPPHFDPPLNGKLWIVELRTKQGGDVVEELYYSEHYRFNAASVSKKGKARQALARIDGNRHRVVWPTAMKVATSPDPRVSKDLRDDARQMTRKLGSDVFGLFRKSKLERVCAGGALENGSFVDGGVLPGSGVEAQGVAGWNATNLSVKWRGKVYHPARCVDGRGQTKIPHLA
jgi:hypothetical protein